MTIDELTNQIEELEKKKVKISKLTPEMRVADFLHDEFCTHNHIDGCGYHYGDWKDSVANMRGSRIEWYERAERLLFKFSEIQIILFVDTYKGYLPQ